MKKRLLITLTISLILILAIGITSNADQQGFTGIISKIAGVIKAKDGTLYSTPGHKENKEIALSIDPKSGTQTKKAEVNPFQINGNKFTSNLKHSKTINFNSEGVNKELKFEYISKDGKCIILENPQEAVYTLPIPKSANYILEFNESIYTLDLAGSTIYPFLKDKTGIYDKQTLKAMVKEGTGVLIWGANPCINQNGTKVTFISNREAFQNNNGKTQVWIKDLATGDEYCLYDSSGECLGWDDEDNVYYQDFGTVIKINTNSQEVKVIKENLSFETKMAYPILIIPSNNQLDINNLVTSENRILKDNGINEMSNIKTNQVKNKIAFLNRPKKGGSEANVIILDIYSMQYKSLEPVENTFIEDYSWLDNDRLLVTTTEKDSLSQETYLIDINEIKEEGNGN